MTSIFDKIRAAKAAKEAQSATSVVPAATAASPVTEMRTGLRMPNALRRPVPAGVRVEQAPEPAMEFDPVHGFGGGELVYDDADLAEDDDDEDDAQDDDEDDEGDVEAGYAATGSAGFGGFEIDDTPEPPAPVQRAPLRLNRTVAEQVEDAPAPEPEPVAEPEPAPAPRKPLLRRHSPAIHAAEPAKPVTAPEPPAPEKRPAIDPNSPLGKLKARAQPNDKLAQREAAAFVDQNMNQRPTPKLGLSMPKSGAMSGLAPAAKTVIETAKVEKIYTVEQYLHDWRDLEELDENADAIDIKRFNEERARIIRMGCARIQQVFETELDGLAVAQANDYAVTEIANLVKLTFLRVKEAPGAYAVLDLADRAQLIKGMRAMAAKRNAAVKSRKPNEGKDLSAAMESMGLGEHDGEGAFSGFDLTAFGV